MAEVSVPGTEYRQMSILPKRKRDASPLTSMQLCKAKLRGEIRDEELKRMVGLQLARMRRGNELPRHFA